MFLESGKLGGSECGRDTGALEKMRPVFVKLSAPLTAVVVGGVTLMLHFVCGKKTMLQFDVEFLLRMGGCAKKG